MCLFYGHSGCILSIIVTLCLLFKVRKQKLLYLTDERRCTLHVTFTVVSVRTNAAWGATNAVQSGVTDFSKSGTGRAISERRTLQLTVSHW
jgi:hypothetical protein